MRLIDADVLLERLDKQIKNEWNDKTYTTWANAFEDAAFLVEIAPAVETKPIVYAHWVNKGLYTAICSNCGKLSGDIGNWCSYCGAKMNSEGENTND